MADDDNLQLDSDYTYSLYRPTSSTGGPSTIGSGVAITTLNGLTGPTLNLNGGATGYSFAPGGTTITLTGAAESIRESSGPTVLDIAAIADGEFLKRVGTDIVGAAAASSTLTEVTTAIDYLLSDADDVVFVDTSGGDVTITLHDPTTAKQKYYDIKMIVTGNDMILDGDGANIDGAGSVTTALIYTSYTLIPDNANGEWFII